MTDPIRTEGLARRFRGTPVVDGLDLAVEPGSIYGLVGPNGAGKTTTLRMLLNILPPSAGVACVLGVDTRRLGAPEFAQIGYVSENQDLPDWMTVGYFLRYLRPFYPAWSDARAEALVAQFELPLDRRLRDLSHGMRMKAALASSLAYAPRLLVLDEPFGGLDPLVRDDVIAGLLDASPETTILISSHDLAEIESFATHIGFLDRGRLRVSQSLSALSDRFREVEVTVSAPAAIARDWPAAWLQPEAAASVVRFVDSNFDRERTPAELRRHFGEHARVAMTPMTLRAIFIALAKSKRAA